MPLWLEIALVVFIGCLITACMFTVQWKLLQWYYNYLCTKTAADFISSHPHPLRVISTSTRRVMCVRVKWGRNPEWIRVEDTELKLCACEKQNKWMCVMMEGRTRSEWSTFFHSCANTRLSIIFNFFHYFLLALMKKSAMQNKEDVIKFEEKVL